MVPFQWIPFQYTHIYFFHNLVLCKEHFYPRFTLHHIQYPFNFFFFFSFSIKVLFFVQNIFTLLCPHRPPFYTIYLPSSYTKLFIFLNYGLVHFNLTDLIFILTLMVHVLSDVLAPSILLPTIASVYDILLPTIASVYHTSSDYCIRICLTSSDYCIRICHTSSDYCIRICTTVSDLLATPKQCPTIYSAPTLLFPTYCIATSNRAIASACIPPIPMYWHAHIHIGVILLHVLYCFRVINNT